MTSSPITEELDWVIDSVLIVDDQPLVRDLVASMCAGLGYTDADLVGSAAEALALLRKKSYAFVLCDWRMQPMTGLDLLQAIRSDMSLATTKFLMMTSQGNVEAVMASKRAGVDGYLFKPFSPAALSQAIATLKGGN